MIYLFKISKIHIYRIIECLIYTGTSIAVFTYLFVYFTYLVIRKESFISG
jgi:hypothetical protein